MLHSLFFPIISKDAKVAFVHDGIDSSILTFHRQILRSYYIKAVLHIELHVQQQFKFLVLLIMLAGKSIARVIGFN